jgi:hypothetical protein
MVLTINVSIARIFVVFKLRTDDRVLGKCYSDNSCWPTNKDWEKLNQTVSGALQLAVPPGAVCYKNFENGTSVYDAAKCADTQANWGNEQWLYDPSP